MGSRFLLSFLVCCCVSAAEQPGKTAAHTVQATGEATVSAQPDRAEISVAVSTTAPTAEAAASQNATQTSQVLDALKRTLEAGGSLKTTGYSINPEYAYEQGRSPRLTGYHANNSVLVTVDNLALVGKVIDTATRSGANSIAGISFTLRDDRAVRSRALAEAAANAHENAETIAKALNVRVTGVLEAQTANVPIVRPLPMMQMKMAAQVATPVETGTLDIHASVVVTLEVQ